MLRRKDNFTPDLLTFEKLTLNRSTYELIYDGRTQALSGKEFQVMEMLMQNRGIIVTAEQLITHIWGWNTDVDTSAPWRRYSPQSCLFWIAVIAPIPICSIPLKMNGWQR